MGPFAGANRYLPLSNGVSDERNLSRHGHGDARLRSRGGRASRRITAVVVMIVLFGGFFMSMAPKSTRSADVGSYSTQRESGLRSLLDKEYLGQMLQSYAPARIMGLGKADPSPPLRLAVIVKTGASTAYSRLPYHIFDVGDAGATYPGPASQVDALGNNIHITRYFVSDHSMVMGKEKVVDVLANLTELFKQQEPFTQYNILQEELKLGRLPGEGDKYHLLDRYKFLAMHQYVYEQDPTADFQLAMDDDTVIFYPGLVRWLASSGYKADEPHYLGTRKGDMADGGAGYILSRAVLDTLYGQEHPLKHDPGTTKPLPEHAEVIEAIGDLWCGDCSMAAVTGTVMKGKLPEHRLTGGGWHFAYSPDQLAIQPGNWHHPLFSMHHLNGMQTVKLRRLEAELARTLPPTDTPRICDAFQTLRPRFFDQILPIDEPAADGDRGAMSWPLPRDRPEPLQLRAIAENAASDEAAPQRRNDPFYHADHWVADNPDKHANMTVCEGACLDRQAGLDDKERCSSACLGITDCLSWALHGRERKCTLFHGALFIGRKFDGNKSGFHVERIRKAFGEMPCGDSKLRRDYRHSDMQASTYFPEQEGWVKTLA